MDRDDQGRIVLGALRALRRGDGERSLGVDKAVNSVNLEERQSSGPGSGNDSPLLSTLKPISKAPMLGPGTYHGVLQKIRKLPRKLNSKTSPTPTRPLALKPSSSGLQATYETNGRLR